MRTRMIKTNDNLYHVEVEHSRYGWIRISETPLPHADAEKACKRAEKWGRGARTQRRMDKKSSAVFVRSGNPAISNAD